MIKVKRYQPTQLEAKLYTLARTVKILGLKRDDIEFIYPMAGDKVMIGLFNTSVILDKAQYLVLLVSDRQKRTSNLVATQNAFNSQVYTVRNLDKNSLYQVHLEDEHLTCECQDYENQVNDFGTKQVACKHIYTVLNKLGYGSLKDYIKYQRAEKQAYQKHLDRELYMHLALAGNY